VNYFAYRDQQLCAEAIPLSDIAEHIGTPCYIYSRAALEAAYRTYDQAFSRCDHLICYAVKANSNLGVLNVFAQLGSGFDIVSGGELERVIRAGGDPRKTVFSGVGKSEAEMHAALVADILCFNVESESEVRRLNHIAGELGKTAAISLRINPDIDVNTHPYIATGLKENKFGITFEDALSLYRSAAKMPHLKITGVGCHIGSQLVEVAPFASAFQKLLDLVDRLAEEHIDIAHIDFGGGLGIRYRNETPPSTDDYAQTLLNHFGTRKHKILLEPGRALVGNAGILLARVEYLKHGKHRNFAVLDAAMNDLMRPALYGAWHDIQPVRPRPGQTRLYEVVGPVCESGDFLGHDRELNLAEGDLVAIMSAGAYGMTMSSNYNTRPRAAEVMADGGSTHLIRERETIAQLLASEQISR